MGFENSDNARMVRKVQPYPIEADLVSEGLKKRVEILRLTPLGFLARMAPTVILHVGELYECQFQLPVMRHLLKAKMRMVKTYDRAPDPKTKVVERLVEAHFVELEDFQKKNILKFLHAIGQK